MRPNVVSPSAAAGLLLLSLLVGCTSSNENGELGQPVIIERNAADPGPDLSDDERERIEEAIEEIENLLRNEEFDRALDLTDSQLEEDLPNDLLRRVQLLRIDARKRIYARQVVRGSILPDRDLYAFGEEIRIRIVLENLSSETITIPVRKKDTSDGYLFLRIERERVDVYGNEKSESEQGRVALPGDIEIPAAAVWDAPRTIPTGKRAHDGFTLFRIEGHIRPAVLRSGKHEYYRRIELEPVEIRVMPRNYEPLAADPAGSLRDALKKRAPVHLLIAAELMPTGERYDATRELIRALRAGPGPMTGPIVASLRRLTGEPHGVEPDAWIEWWSERHDDER